MRGEGSVGPGPDVGASTPSAWCGEVGGGDRPARLWSGLEVRALNPVNSQRRNSLGDDSLTSMMRSGLRMFVAAVTAAFAVITAPSAGAAVTHVAELSVAGEPAGAVLGPVAVSGGAAVVVGSAGGFVFTRPSGGWADEAQAATMAGTPSASGAAVSGHVIVSGGGAPGVPSWLDVFVEPLGGWSGVAQPSAQLTASDGASLQAAAISESTIAAVGLEPSTGLGEIYVFSAPIGGWSGRRREVARLVGPPEVRLSYVAISGRTIVAAAGDRAEVFSEPAGGWAGTIRPSATLLGAGDRPLNPVAIDGQTIVAGLNVFTEPMRGWTGGIHPAAQLGLIANPHSLGWVEAISGRLIAISTYSLGPNHQCPCASSLWLFTEPSGGWSGTLAAAPVLNPSTAFGPLPVALADPNVFTSGGDALEVDRVTGSFGHRAAPPTVRRVALTGITQGTPRLRFRVQAGTGGLIVGRIAVRLPAGLSFSASRRRLNAGVSVVAAGHAVRYRLKNRLVVALTPACRRIWVTITSRAIIESPRLRHRARKLARPSHHAHPRRNATLPLTLRFEVAYASGPDTPISLPVNALK